MGFKDRPGRGRPGESRYKDTEKRHGKLERTITYDQFVELLQKMEMKKGGLYTSLLVILYYTGLRIAEIVGDGERRYLILSDAGIEQRRMGRLPTDWREIPELHREYIRPAVEGILKEHIRTEGNLIKISAPALKRGIRKATDELVLSLEYPYVALIREQERATEPREKVWPMSTWHAWHIISTVSDGEFYPHFFRFNRATLAAGDPTVSILDLRSWFGWKSTATIESYIGKQESLERVGASIASELPPELRPKVEQ